VRANEVGPSHLPTPFWGRRNSKAAENVAHALIGNAMAENLNCSGDAIISPAAILTRKTDDQFRELTSEARPSRIQVVAGAVELVGRRASGTRRGWCLVWQL